MARRSSEIGGCENDTLRTLGEVQKRTLALGAVVAMSFGTPQEDLLKWLRQYSLDKELTPLEHAFMSGDASNEKSLINFTWQSERLVILLWALGKLEERPLVSEQCGTAPLEELLPPYGDESTEDFLASCVLRPEDELFDAAIELQELHVQARQQLRKQSSLSFDPAVDVEVVQERHHAINWLVGYEDQSWDEVTTDT